MSSIITTRQAYQLEVRTPLGWQPQMLYYEREQAVAMMDGYAAHRSSGSAVGRAFSDGARWQWIEDGHSVEWRLVAVGVQE